MKRLILVRHAKSSREDPRLRDLDRPLNERGERDAPEMGRRLARRRVNPDLLLCSPARRALDTARLLARELDFPWKRIRTDARIYEAEPEDLLEVVRGIGEEVVQALLVGHNPGLTGLGQLLAGDFREEMPTGAVLAVDLPADVWATVRRGAGRTRFFDFPKKPYPR